MNAIIDNWELLVAGICMLSAIVTSFIYFVEEPRANKVANVKEWLLFAVIEAEKKFGDKTGAIKLRFVYDLACKNFPWLPKAVSFTTFSKWVDDALVWARVQLTSNEAIQTYVEGE